MISKRLYTTWVGCPGRDIYTEAHKALFMRCFESWRRLMPDYPVTIITRENVFDCGYDPVVKDCYDRGFLILNWVTPKWIYTHGGIYIDMDMEAVQRFDGLLGAECFVGRETDGFANAAILGAVPGHPFVDRVLSMVQRMGCDVPEQNEGGPRLYTRILNEWGWDGRRDETQVVRGVTVHKAEVFYPFLWNVPQAERQATVTQETVAMHHWASSWTGH